MGAVVELEMTDLRPARCHKHNVYVVYVATAIDVVGGQHNRDHPIMLRQRLAPFMISPTSKSPSP